MRISNSVACQKKEERPPKCAVATLLQHYLSRFFYTFAALSVTGEQTNVL